MARITIHLGTRERLEARISKATPLGALGTEALVYLGAICLSGPAAAMRALADALTEAADLADARRRPRRFQRARAGRARPRPVIA